MLDEMLHPLAFAAALGSGLIAGAFFAFSTFVMKALARIAAGSGIAAMQSINVVVINPLFMVVFLGTAVLCVIAIVAALLRWSAPGSACMLAGGLLYATGTFLVTMVFNVPLNNKLAALSPGDPEAAQKWTAYVGRWTMWNHVRTTAALLAMTSFLVAIRRLPPW